MLGIRATSLRPVATCGGYRVNRVIRRPNLTLLFAQWHQCYQQLVQSDAWATTLFRTVPVCTMESKDEKRRLDPVTTVDGDAAL